MINYFYSPTSMNCGVTEEFLQEEKEKQLQSLLAHLNSEVAAELALADDEQVNKETLLMLQMKYGLMEPILTESEMYLIQNENLV